MIDKYDKFPIAKIQNDSIFALGKQKNYKL